MICTFRLIHYYLKIYFKNFKINILKYMNLIQLVFICAWISMTSMLKKAKVELEVLTDMICY